MVLNRSKVLYRTSVDVLRASGAAVFSSEGETGPVEGLLVWTSDGPQAWRNVCPHWHAKLTRTGRDLVTAEGRLRCMVHGAIFEATTGLCEAGPCEGAHLDRLEIEVAEDGTLAVREPSRVGVGRLRPLDRFGDAT